MEQNYFAEDEKKHLKNGRSGRSVSVSTLIISVITAIVVVLIVVSKLPTIIGWVGIDSASDQKIVSELNIGDELVLTGFVQSDGDIVNYTHTIDGLTFGKIGLKSSKVNLNKYTKEVYLEGVIEKFYLGVPVVSVDIIYYLDIEDEEGLDEDSTVSYESKYLPKLGLFLDSDFFDKYSLLNEGTNGVLKVKNNDTNEIVEINYFVCSDGDNNKNCKKFNEMFKESSSQKFVDSYEITYYKQSETQSWFFSSDSMFGYFINDYEDGVVKSLVKDIQVINKKFVEKNVLNKVDLLCWESGNGIKNITNSSLYFQESKLLLDVEGKNNTAKFSCQLEVDPNLKNMAKLLKLEILESENDEKNEGSNKVEEIVYDRSTEVPQFPINLEKALTFTSRKGFSYVFPSSNIAYAAQNTQEDFSQLGVNCYSAMHVVQYSEKELIEQKASVKVYECSIKKGFDDSDQKLIYKQIGDRHFVIQVVDPAWLQFAHNIAINILD